MHDETAVKQHQSCDEDVDEDQTHQTIDSEEISNVLTAILIN